MTAFTLTISPVLDNGSIVAGCCGYGGLNDSGDKGNAGGPTIRDHRKK
jgi:hypothetical protein